MKKLKVGVSVLLLMVLLTSLLTLTSCGKEYKYRKRYGATVVVATESTRAKVDNKIDFTVTFYGMPSAKSIGVYLQYDHDVFELVGGDMTVNGIISDFSDDIGVVVFESPREVNKTVMTFTLKCKAKASKEEITCKASIIDENNNKVEIDTMQGVTLK